MELARCGAGLAGRSECEDEDGGGVRRGWERDVRGRRAGRVEALPVPVDGALRFPVKVVADVVGCVVAGCGLSEADGVVRFVVLRAVDGPVLGAALPLRTFAGLRAVDRWELLSLPICTRGAKAGEIPFPAACFVFLDERRIDDVEESAERDMDESMVESASAWTFSSLATPPALRRGEGDGGGDL